MIAFSSEEKKRTQINTDGTDGWLNLSIVGHWPKLESQIPDLRDGESNRLEQRLRCPERVTPASFL
ncbi:MAG: hypothetical protein DWQ47_08000 [Acidobacteria bacterium]|nr:MAG: hypothetical protein DWQ32_16100 [Acidobacteriota bacterium]REJ99144.1 MAG: hypothetical protein DWQ38_13875 [Acidobacteriota bacterium]REK16135.1 MAG: hypothetical protein DWQ43_03810 [Acidobacteriota bacterium]REK43816.1 MAG: hypothetical protein DWQ47_08000 [Acidobacteriota bacterium]